MAGWREAFAGAGLGLLTGLLIGLSSAPIVAAFLAVIGAGIGAFLGLAAQDGANRALRAGCFGVAAALGVLLGIWLRAGDRAGLSPEAEHASWTAIGFSSIEARDLVAFARLGVAPRDRVLVGAAAGGAAGASPAPPDRSRRATALFNDVAGACARLESSNADGRRAMLSESAQRPAAGAGERTIAALAATATPAQLEAAVVALCQ